MERFWEVDFLRSVSVVLMVLFNWSFALHFLEVYTLVGEGSFIYWEVFPRFIASSFLLLVGVSLTLSWNRFVEEDPSVLEIYRKYIGRGFSIFVLGVLITLVTLAFYPESFIFFGILHLIGFSIMVSVPFIRKPFVSLLASMFFFTGSFLLDGFTGSNIVEYSIGLDPVTVSTFDYFPIFPWTGMVFLGIFLGHIFYPGGRRRFEHFGEIDSMFLDWISVYLGQNSLLIYLVHQPLLVLLLLLLGFQVF